MRRVLVPELLDSDLGTPEEIAESLRDLERINRCFGGVATTAATLARVKTRIAGQLSILDVAAGISTVVASAAKRAGVDVAITKLDRSAAHLANGNNVAGNALALPFRNNSFDVVHSCLFLHHLTDEEAMQFLREALRVARTAVLINDLRRSWLHLMLVYAGKPLFSRITRHDSEASVRRAYTVREVRALVESVDAFAVEIIETHLYRFGMVVWK